MTTPADLLAALQWRYATKQFDPSRRIPEETWNALEESLILAPSSFGLQPWKFLVVKDPVKRAELVGVSWGQKQVAEASHLVVLAARRDITTAEVDLWVNRMSEVQGRTREELSPYREMIAGFAGRLSPEERAAWNARQIYIVLGQLLTSAAVLGIDACPMEGIDPAAYDRILGLEGTEFATRVVCPLGYRSPDDKYAALPKTRFPKDAVIQRV